MTLLRGCPRHSIEVSFISGISKPIWLSSECSLLPAVLLGPSPCSNEEASPVSDESLTRPGVPTSPSPSPCWPHFCWLEVGCGRLASSSSLVFFFLPGFFFLVTLKPREREGGDTRVPTEGEWAGSQRQSPGCVVSRSAR